MKPEDEHNALVSRKRFMHYNSDIKRLNLVVKCINKTYRQASPEYERSTQSFLHNGFLWVRCPICIMVPLSYNVSCISEIMFYQDLIPHTVLVQLKTRCTLF